ncbi:efflux RND transporter periplasmic adaptor subunit [Mucilaginibacter antarcticus]
MFAYFNVSEPEYLDYQTNVKDRGDRKVSLLLANGEPLAAKGEVETIESEFNAETGNIAFRARFPNSNRLLRNGETGKIQMIVPLRNALIIPQKATYEIQDKIYVFVVGNDGVLHSKNINIVGEMSDLYVVKSGLSAHDKILLDGIQKVKDDDKIKSEYLQPKVVVSQLRLKAE